MLTLTELEQHIEKITYKPSWNFRLVKDDSRYWEYQSMVRFELRLAVTFRVPNTYAEDPNLREEIKIGMHHILRGPFMTIEQFERAVLEAIDRAERHETREWFRVDGAMKYDPHKLQGGRNG